MGCETAKDSFEAADRAGTLDAWNAFLEKYGREQPYRAKLARQAVSAITFDECERITVPHKQIQCFRDIADRFSGSYHAKKATQRVELIRARQSIVRELQSKDKKAVRAAVLAIQWAPIGFMDHIEPATFRPLLELPDTSDLNQVTEAYESVELVLTFLTRHTRLTQPLLNSLIALANRNRRSEIADYEAWLDDALASFMATNCALSEEFAWGRLKASPDTPGPSLRIIEKCGGSVANTQLFAEILTNKIESAKLKIRRHRFTDTPSASMESNYRAALDLMSIIPQLEPAPLLPLLLAERKDPYFGDAAYAGLIGLGEAHADLVLVSLENDTSYNGLLARSLLGDVTAEKLLAHLSGPADTGVLKSTELVRSSDAVIERLLKAFCDTTLPRETFGLARKVIKALAERPGRLDAVPIRCGPTSKKNKTGNPADLAAQDVARRKIQITHHLEKTKRMTIEQFVQLPRLLAVLVRLRDFQSALAVITYIEGMNAIMRAEIKEKSAPLLTRAATYKNLRLMKFYAGALDFINASAHSDLAEVIETLSEKPRLVHLNKEEDNVQNNGEFAAPHGSGKAVADTEKSHFVSAILSSLSQEDPARLRLSKGLIYLDDPAARRLIVNIVSHGELSADAVEALAETMPPVGPDLEGLLARKSAVLRCALMLALGVRNDLHSLPVLRKLAESHDELTRNAAQVAIWRMMSNYD